MADDGQSSSAAAAMDEPMSSAAAAALTQAMREQAPEPEMEEAEEDIVLTASQRRELCLDAAMRRMKGK